MQTHDLYLRAQEPTLEQEAKETLVALGKRLAELGRKLSSDKTSNRVLPGCKPKRLL